MRTIVRRQLTCPVRIDEQHPGKYPERYLRTLQRRVKHWQATQGPDKEVMFRQSVPAGHQGLSDFTHPNTAITIDGKAFAHLLYQFRLAFTGWRHAHVIQGGESYSALADGLQSALHTLGGSPKEHRTDSLSAAYVNTSGSYIRVRSFHATYIRVRSFHATFSIPDGANGKTTKTRTSSRFAYMV